jgi:Tol biopolymer transport system component
VTHTGSAVSPLWSRSGTQIVFDRIAHSRASVLGERVPIETWTLWSVRPDGSEAHALESTVAGRVDVAGSFSPDGSELAFTRQPNLLELLRHGTPPAIMVVNPAGGAARVLVNHAAEPDFAPNGRWITYVSDRDRNGTLSYGEFTSSATELYVARADGSDQRRLTHTRDINEDVPEWSANCSSIVYQHGEVTGNAQATSVWRVSPDGGDARPILADRRLDTWYMEPARRPAAR